MGPGLQARTLEGFVGLRLAQERWCRARHLSAMAGTKLIFPMFGGEFMYQRPQLTRFGSLRELTQAGINGVDDPWYLRNADGNLACDFLKRNCS